ncbi:hypothetical protein GMST_11570 [Geomonas silvestris]|uniref:Uncharacterized protein n=1 Tax=Geomonas silvestris TaxID=2740184 RepID=A0A6V8MFV6_9BACT|nr:hypothetical protein GMST_11570 [Geomonas silvestris]
MEAKDFIEPFRRAGTGEGHLGKTEGALARAAFWREGQLSLNSAGLQRCRTE